MSTLDRHRRQSIYNIGNENKLINTAPTMMGKMAPTPPSNADYDFKVGARVLVHGENTGTVRFVGSTSFQTGRWIGIELDEPKGKNAGVVQGKRYFECKAQHGVFVRPTQVKLLDNNNGQALSRQPSSSPNINNNRRKSMVEDKRSSTIDQRRASKAPTTPPIRRKSMVPPKSTTPPTTSTTTSPTSTTTTTTKRRPTSLMNNDTPRSSITLTASQRRKSLSVKQQLPTTINTTQMARQRSATNQFENNNNVKKSSSPSNTITASPTVLSAKEKQLQALKMLQLQQLQNNNINNNHNEDDSEKEEEEEEEEEEAYDGNEQEIEDDGDDDIDHLTSTPTNTTISTSTPTIEQDEDDENGSTTESEQLMTDNENDTDHYHSSPHHQQQHNNNNNNIPMVQQQQQQQQVYGALAATKPVSKSEQMVPLKDYEELRFKLKILEGKRQEDRERFREHEKIKEEAEQFLTLRNKLQDKIADLQKDVREAKRDLKEALADKDISDNKLNDALESLEMMTLDKEMAEERAETLQEEVTILRDKLEEVSVDLDILKKQADMMNESSGLNNFSGNTNGGEYHNAPLEIVQLERHNERLKEALIRLRDATAEREIELCDRIKDLEKDLFDLSDVKSQADRYKEKLHITEYQLEDLKQQLDDALGAEDLVEQLTEKNLNLTEQIEELRASVDDLEALKELADELEDNHVETEKQLEAEIEHRDMLLREQLERLKASEETSADYEATIQQFRELVTHLQNDLDDLKDKQKSEATEKHSLSSQSQAMMSLNLQLQSTVMKSQAKSIDLELRKLDAAQANDRLAYVQPYLPETFFKTENDPISCLLLFKRLVFKSDLIIKHLDQHYPISEKVVEEATDKLVTVCEMRQKAGWLSDLAKRFVSFIKHCKPDVFIKMNQVYHELIGTERRLNTIVELFRTDDINDANCLHELQRIISQLEHLIDAYIGQYGETNNADQFFALTRALDFNSDRMLVEFTYLQQLIGNATSTDEIQVMEGRLSLDVEYLEPLVRLIVQAKNSKITAKKLLRQLEELSEEALTLKGDHLHRFKTLYAISTKLCRFTYELCHQMNAYIDGKRGSREMISLSALQQIVKDKADEILDIPESSLWEASLKILKSLTSELTTTLQRIENDHKKEKIATEISPWIQRASDMKAEVLVNHDLERKLQQHNDELVKLIKDVKLKDQSLQEANVKIDLLERRMEFAKKEAEQISQLEDALEKANNQEQMYIEAMDNLQAEFDVLEQENNQLKKEVAKKEEKRQSLLKKMNYEDFNLLQNSSNNSISANGSSTSDPNKMDDLPNGYQMMDSHMQTLKAAIRYLRSENAQLKSQDYSRHLELYELPPIIGSPLKEEEKKNKKNKKKEKENDEEDEEDEEDDEVDEDDDDDDDDDDDEYEDETKVNKERIQTMKNQTQILLKDLRMASAAPKVVQLSPSAYKQKGQWQSMKTSPSYQYQQQQSALFTLQQRTKQLQKNIQALSNRKLDDHELVKTPQTLSTATNGHHFAKIKIPCHKTFNSTITSHCIQLNSIKEFDRIHSLFIH
ncbi:dynein associated protein-domain-containing protein [Cunninghamella echinulata]|nr:dynein associated protein-domain-containing protein [Cunninghamella echinulata]